jgi:hypothetical protein
MKCTQIKCMDPDSRQIELHESAALSGVTPNSLSKKKKVRELVKIRRQKYLKISHVLPLTRNGGWRNGFLYGG